MSRPDSPNCPECGHPATDESIRKRDLSEIGYLHEDIRYDCSQCGNNWPHGVPEGEVDSDKWVCKSCGGDYIPHFLYVNATARKIKVRPKCKDCYHTPDDRITIESKFNGDNIRGFFSHHTTTGDRTKAQGDPI